MASAPSMPAATTMQSASSWMTSLRAGNTRCRPATPTSYLQTVLHPIAPHTSLASSATGMSEVPAVSIPTVPPALGRSPFRRSMVVQFLPASTCSPRSSENETTSAMCSGLILETTSGSVLGYRWIMALMSGSSLDSA